MPPDRAAPVSLAGAVRCELREAVRPPYTVPLVVTFNGVLMAAAWFLLPTKWFDWLFTLHGPLAFAMVMAGWMYSDVPATNVLAPDRERVLAALDDPARLSRLLYAQNLTLWCFVAPFCTVVAVIIGYSNNDWPPTLVSITAIAIVPFGTLGVAGWVGILWPYHPRDLRFRWQHRHEWFHMIVRWLALLLVPYGLVPLLAVLVIRSQPGPVVDAVDQWAQPQASHHPLRRRVALAAVVSMGVFYGGHRAGLSSSVAATTSSTTTSATLTEDDTHCQLHVARLDLLSAWRLVAERHPYRARQDQHHPGSRDRSTQPTARPPQAPSDLRRLGRSRRVRRHDLGDQDTGPE